MLQRVDRLVLGKHFTEAIVPRRDVEWKEHPMLMGPEMNRKHLQEVCLCDLTRTRVVAQLLLVCQGEKWQTGLIVYSRHNQKCMDQWGAEIETGKYHRDQALTLPPSRFISPRYSQVRPRPGSTDEDVVREKRVTFAGLLGDS
jgi:hypothetical protein